MDEEDCVHTIQYTDNLEIYSLNEIRQKCFCTNCERDYWRVYTPLHEQAYSDIPPSIVPTVEIIGPETVEVRYESVKRLVYTASGLIDKTD